MAALRGVTVSCGVRAAPRLLDEPEPADSEEVEPYRRGERAEAPSGEGEKRDAEDERRSAGGAAERALPCRGPSRRERGRGQMSGTR